MPTRRKHSHLRAKTRKQKCCAATFHSLHVWQKHMFEHLGWMVLAKSKGYMNDRVDAYVSSVHRLEIALKQKIASVQDADKKADLKIMLENVGVLRRHVDKDFDGLKTSLSSSSL